jgi:hypothetical protein
MMDLHFIGLAMIVGALGALDLRMLGFAKEFPIASMHRLVPWALAGFAINVTTGVLAFIGMPGFYTYDLVFWLKILAILLLGLNAAAFYLTDTFNVVERVGPGEDAPGRQDYSCKFLGTVAWSDYAGSLHPVLSKYALWSMTSIRS